MIVSISRPMCQMCGDRFQVRAGDCCGRCNRIVCRACSRARGRSHESVLCAKCDGVPPASGFRATPAYRAWRRLVLG